MLGRLVDTAVAVAEEELKPRWRRFLASMNLFQFSRGFRFWTSSEVESGMAPELPDLAPVPEMSGEWASVLEEVTPSLRALACEMAWSGLPVPEAEYYNEAIDDDAFAELAWAEASPRLAVLAGDKADFRGKWESQGWEIVTGVELLAEGIGILTPKGLHPEAQGQRSATLGTRGTPRSKP